MKMPRIGKFRLIVMILLALVTIGGLIFVNHILQEKPFREPDIEQVVSTFEVEIGSDSNTDTESEESQDTEYWKEQLIQSVISGYESDGLAAEFHIRAADENTLISYENVRMLGKIMTAEEGHDWPDWATMAIGEVVLNRVKSSEFPNTVSEVITQNNPVQYEPVYSEGWADLQPTERNVRLAVRLLDGESVLKDDSIVFQALFEQGSKTIIAFYDGVFGTITYFCRSYYPELYS